MIESITIYRVENGFIITKNTPTNRVIWLGGNATVFEKIGSEYESGLAGFIREWKDSIEEQVEPPANE